MTAELPRRSIVILSTTPPIPRDYGNRNRVFQTLAFFRNLDFSVSFLLYPFDKEWADDIPREYKELAASFDFFAVIPNSRPLHQPARAYHHDIDEWWDDNIAQYLTWLFARRRYDALLVNYTFLSKAFEYAPKHTLKILDTHDLFSDRREIFETNGVAAEFFYTNEQQERIGFDRSELIIAIKQYEKHIIQTMTRKPVICLPYWDDRPVDRGRPPMIGADHYSHDRPLRLGFIGARNSVNVVNLRRFLETFAGYVKLYNLPVEMLVAGNVCESLDQEYPFLRKVGFVEDIADFYGSIDIIIAPLEFSTGIKIKVGEALARKLPVLATRNAFDGFRPYHSTQDLANLAALCEAIVRAAYGELSQAELATAAHKAAVTAARAQEQAFAVFHHTIVAALRRILIVVDRPFWYRANFFDEMVSQSIEFLAHIMPPIVCYISEEVVIPERIHARADYIRITDAEALHSAFDRVFADYHVAGAIVVATKAQTGQTIERQLKPRRVSTWSLSIDNRGINTAVVFRDAASASDVIELAPLRYSPGTRCSDIGSRHQVGLFVSAAADEWIGIARDCVEQLAEELGLSVRTVTVPSYHEFDSAFFFTCLDIIAGKSIVIVDASFYPAFVLQVLVLQRAAILVVHPDFICPEFVGPQGMPSLEGSVRAFLSGELTARVPAHADTGWSGVWDRLSTEAVAAA